MDFDEIVFEDEEVNKSFIHGDARRGKNKSKLYRIWGAIKDRCHNPDNVHYKRYGGRGIRLYDEWREDYRKFKKYVEEVLGPKPSPLHTLDRTNNNLGYEPGNLAWATRKKQSQNRRSSLEITYKGRTQCLTAWTEELGLDYGATKARLRRGYDVEKAFETPKLHNTTIEFEGRTQTIMEWSVELGINYDKLRKRLQNGWTVEEAFEKVKVGEANV